MTGTVPRFPSDPLQSGTSAERGASGRRPLPSHEASARRGGERGRAAPNAPRRNAAVAVGRARNQPPFKGGRGEENPTHATHGGLELTRTVAAVTEAITEAVTEAVAEAFPNGGSGRITRPGARNALWCVTVRAPGMEI